MEKIWRVALTEYLVAVRSKAFIIGVVMLPVLMTGSFLVQSFAKDKMDVRTRKLAIVDRTSRLFETIQTASEERNRYGIFDEDEDGNTKKVRPEFEVELYDPKPNEEPEFTLSDRVRDQELFAFAIIDENVVSIQDGNGAQVAYYTQTPTFMEMPNWLRGVVNEEVKQLRFTDEGLDRDLIRRVTRNVDFKRLGLAKKTESGEVKKAEEENELKTFGVPAGAMFLLFMLVMTSTPALMSNVLEEKLQKIAEVLISTVSPFQLMMGKVIGAVLVSMTLTVLYVGAIVFALWKNDVSDMVPVSLYFWFLLFQLLALMIFGSICAGIGAACSEIKDSQNMMFPVMILIMIPLFTWMPILQSPTSNFARAISLFPPATPMTMLLRIAVPPGPPLWEVALGVALTVLFMIVCVWAGSKIFRIGILSQGQTPSLKRLAQWLFSK